jgi:hypothetical protein
MAPWAPSNRHELDRTSSLDPAARRPPAVRDHRASRTVRRRHVRVRRRCGVATRADVLSGPRWPGRDRLGRSAWTSPTSSKQPPIRSCRRCAASLAPGRDRRLGQMIEHKRQTRVTVGKRARRRQIARKDQDVVGHAEPGKQRHAALKSGRRRKSVPTAIAWSTREPGSAGSDAPTAAPRPASPETYARRRLRGTSARHA